MEKQVGLLDKLKALFGREPEAQTQPPAQVEEEAILPGEGVTERRKRVRVNAREGTKVLIIDDSKTIVMALKKFLRSAGYETLEALDAESGLALMHEQKPELVFLDIVLPGMNGFAALRTIRRDPQLRDIPVIMMSGNEQAMEQFFGTRIGACLLYTSPSPRDQA
eukprot:TRINITY_DN4957_c0_g1_i2.p2 TRINITY_DN4957_c0_g1~~TRINITY_DN4957_c0_g1_i2.p2  ORF type:complete len:165 (+),score=27.50 TRINITY_DN4957_c0_g1_i2:173-667(+)